MTVVSPAARRLVVALVAIAVVAGCRAPVRRPRRVPPPPVSYEATIADRVAQYGPVARARLVPFFRAAGVPYPPARFVLLGFEHERELQLLAAGPGAACPTSAVRDQGASGVLGPKLREGDRQVPEGVYTIVDLNPNSVAHLSLALSYPNDYDRARAAEEGRDDLGGDIMIHGGSGSAGCLAVGDVAAEECRLAADAGWRDAVVLVSPSTSGGTCCHPTTVRPRTGRTTCTCRCVPS